MSLKRWNKKLLHKPVLKIIATDISEDAVNVSKINAASAGVEELIEFAVCDFEKTELPGRKTRVLYFLTRSMATD